MRKFTIFLIAILMIIFTSCEDNSDLLIDELLNNYIRYGYVNINPSIFDSKINSIKKLVSDTVDITEYLNSDISDIQTSYLLYNEINKISVEQNKYYYNIKFTIMYNTENKANEYYTEYDYNLEIEKIEKNYIITDIIINKMNKIETNGANIHFHGNEANIGDH